MLPWFCTGRRNGWGLVNERISTETVSERPRGVGALRYFTTRPNLTKAAVAEHIRVLMQQQQKKTYESFCLHISSPSILEKLPFLSRLFCEVIYTHSFESLHATGAKLVDNIFAGLWAKISDYIRHSRKVFVTCQPWSSLRSTCMLYIFCNVRKIGSGMVNSANSLPIWSQWLNTRTASPTLQPHCISSKRRQNASRNPWKF